jgi:hypothetical protein
MAFNKLVGYGQDTEPDGAQGAVRSACRALPRDGFTSEDLGGSKGNEDTIDMQRSERVNCDPQGFQWNECPRTDGDNDHEDCCF